MKNFLESPYMKKKIKEEESSDEGLGELIKGEKKSQKEAAKRQAEEDFFEDKVAGNIAKEAGHQATMARNRALREKLGINKNKKEEAPGTTDDIEDARAELAERMETLKGRQALKKKWEESKKEEEIVEMEAELPPQTPEQKEIEAGDEDIIVEERDIEDDWKAREMEAAKILGEEEMEKIKRMRAEIHGETEAGEAKLESKIDAGDILVGAALGAAAAGALAGEKTVEEESDAVEKEEEARLLDKLSEKEIKKRIGALQEAAGKILEDAATWKPTKKESTALKKWIKKGGSAEEWPLEDTVTPENYKERLAKYNIAGFIDARLIGKNKDAYAVVAEELQRYKKRLGGKDAEKPTEIEAEPVKPKKAGKEKKTAEELKTESFEKSFGVEEPEEAEVAEDRFKIGDKVKVKGKNGWMESGWRFDGYDDSGRAIVSKKRMLRKPLKQLISKEELEKLNP
jgi:hypothetical protein